MLVLDLVWTTDPDILMHPFRNGEAAFEPGENIGGAV